MKRNCSPWSHSMAIKSTDVSGFEFPSEFGLISVRKIFKISCCDGHFNNLLLSIQPIPAC